MRCVYSMGRNGICQKDQSDNDLGLCEEHHARAVKVLAGENFYTVPCKNCGKKRSLEAGGVCHSCYTKQWRKDQEKPAKESRVKTCVSCGKAINNRTKSGRCQPCSNRARATTKTCAECGTVTNRATRGKCNSCYARTYYQERKAAVWATKS